MEEKYIISIKDVITIAKEIVYFTHKSNTIASHYGAIKYNKIEKNFLYPNDKIKSHRTDVF